MHPVSHFDFCGLADICRYGFDVAALTVELNDSISTVWRDSRWLHDVGTSQVSRFAFLRYFGIDTLDLDVYRFDLHPAVLTPESNDSIGTFGRVSGWLHCIGEYPVSCFIFSRCIDLHSFEFQSSTSTAGSMDPIQAF